MYPRGYWMMAHMMNVFKSYQEYSPCALIVLAWLIMTVCAHFYSDVSSIWWEMSRRRHEYWLSKMQCKIKLEPLFADLRTHQNSWYVVTFNMLWELFIPIFYLFQGYFARPSYSYSVHNLIIYYAAIVIK